MTADTACRLFYATDIHGSDVCFRKFLNAAQVYEADVLVLGGDITGKELVPVVKTNGSWRATKGGVAHRLETRSELDAFMRNARAVGAYPAHVSADEEEALVHDHEFRDECFRRAMLDGVAGWAELADERLRPQGVACYIGLGNDDDPAVADVLRDASWVEYPEGEIHLLGGSYEMVSWGWSNRTPWDSPREQDEDELGSAIRAMAERLSEPRTAIFNLHCPPFKSSLDVAPAIDDEFRPVTRGGQLKMIPVGSTAVRSAVEEYRPLVGLFGHVHDSRSIKRIKGSVCINPGSDYQHGVLRGAIVQLSKRKLRASVLTTG